MAKQMGVAIAAVALVSGCSTRPREFRANVVASLPVERNFDTDMRECQVMVRKGIKKDFRRTAAQVAAGAGGGIAIGVAATSVALSNATTLSGALGATSVGGAAMSVGGPLIAFGVSRIIRTGREKKYRAGLESCLGEYGYQVAGWEKQKKLTKAEVAAAVAAMQAADAAAPLASVAPPSASEVDGKDKENPSMTPDDVRTSGENALPKAT
jgi:hypothetical protein